MAVVKLSRGLVAPLAKFAWGHVAGGVNAIAVGYGESEQNDGAGDSEYGAGRKREGTIFYKGAWGETTASTGERSTLLTVRGPTGQDTCEGDSGGPLILDGLLLGVLSGGDSTP